MTGVDKLRAEGYYGSGLRVAVVDSGIDYKHPALGGCYGEGCLVAFGYDLVNDVNDPYDNCDGHGIILLYYPLLCLDLANAVYRNPRVRSHCSPDEPVQFHRCRTECDARPL